MNSRKYSIGAVILILTLLPSLGWTGAVITYHGRLLDTNKLPVESSNVTFRIRIYSPNPKKCLLYEEIRSIDMSNSQGVFVIPIGDGLGTRTGNDPGLQLERVFTNDPNTEYNTTNTPLITCNTGTSYAPDLLDQRHLEVSFDDNTGTGNQTLPLMDVNFVPFSVNSFDSQNIGGTPAESVVRLSSGTATPLSLADFSELLAIVNGTSNQYERSGQLRGASVPALGNGQVLGWNAGGWQAITPITSFSETDPQVKDFAKVDLPSCGANQFLKDDGAGNMVCASVIGSNGGTVTSITAGTGLSHETSPGSPLTSSGTISLENSGVVAGQYTKVIVDLKGRVTSGANLSSADIPNLDASKITSGTIAQNVSATSVAATNVNSTNLRIYDGASEYLTFTLPAGGTSYSIKWPNAIGNNGDVLQSDASGNLSWIAIPSAPVESVAGKTGTVTLSTADISGLGSSATMNVAASGDASAGEVVKGNDSRLTNDRVPTGGAGGDLSGSYPNPSVAKIQGRSVETTAPTDGQVLLWDNGNTTWKAQYVRAQDIRTMWGGTQLIPSTACSANESMVWSAVTDRFTCQTIGTLDASAITTGTIAPGRIGSGVTTNAFLTTDGSGVPGWQALNSDLHVQYALLAGRSGGQILHGGAAASDSLVLDSTSHSTKGTVLLAPSGGSVGVGTSSPTGVFDVEGGTAASGLNGGNIRLNAQTGGAGNTDGGVVLLSPGNSTGAGRPGVAVVGSDTDVSIANQTVGQGGLYVKGGIYGADGITTNYQFRFGNGTSHFTANTSGIASHLLTTVNGAEVMRIIANGNVGIGTTDPTQLFHVNGTALATAWNTTSDERLKEDIKEIENPLKKILQLRGVTFKWRTDIMQPTKHDRLNDIGVVAQEVEMQFPEVVNTGADGFKSVNYSSLVAPLIGAIKEFYRDFVGQKELIAMQTRKIDTVLHDLETKVDRTELQFLRLENSELKDRINRLERHLMIKKSSE